MRKALLLSGMVLALVLLTSSTSRAQLDPGALFAACQTTASATPSVVRGSGKTTKMWCAVVDREGQLLLDKATDTGGTPAAPAGSDAWRGSIEISIAKAYSAVAFSSGDQALDTRTLGLLSRTDGPGSVAPKNIGRMRVSLHFSGSATRTDIGRLPVQASAVTMRPVTTTTAS